MSWAANSLLATGATGGHPAAAGHTTARHHAAHHTPAHGSGLATPAPTPSASPSHAPAHHKATKHSQAAGSASACAASDVTLTLSSPQYWYQPGLTPRFTVRAASTASQPCRFDMSPKSVSVVVDTSSGRSVWNSADCASGSGSDSVVLASGTHGTLRVSWHRRTGCGDTGNLVRPGEYRIAAVADGVHSKSVNIVLGAKGVSGP